MKSVPFAGAQAPAVVAGMMRIIDKSDEQIRELYDAARGSGVDFFDHADIYGRDHGCERRFAEALQLSSAERGEITIQTKAGIVPAEAGTYFDFSYEHLVGQVEGSLRALNTDYIDVLLLHRPDALVEPEEVARAFDHLEGSGKVRAFGVSNHTPRQIDLLRTAVRQPIVANQIQLSITHAPAIAQGIAANIAGADQALTLDGGGVLDYCRLNGITVQAWSPLQSGRPGVGTFLGAPEFPELNAAIDRLAKAYDVTPLGIVTAWLTRHPAQMQVVLGTTTPSRMGEAARGSDVVLTRPEWYELLRAAGYFVP